LGEDCDDAKELIPISALRDKKCVDISCGSAVSFAVTDKGEYEQWYNKISNFSSAGIVMWVENNSECSYCKQQLKTTLYQCLWKKQYVCFIS
jgi:hypothetical protein